MRCCYIGHKRSNRIKWVIDVTIGYPERQPLDLFTITSASRPPCQVSVHYRCYKADSVPCEHDELLRWLYDRWAEKDRLLDHFHRTGEFPVASSDPPAPRLLAMSNTRSILINMLLVVSACFIIKVTLIAIVSLADLIAGYAGTVETVLNGWNWKCTMGHSGWK